MIETNNIVMKTNIKIIIAKRYYYVVVAHSSKIEKTNRDLSFCKITDFLNKNYKLKINQI